MFAREVSRAYAIAKMSLATKSQPSSSVPNEEQR